jgi:hypothetical protein
LSRYIAYGTRDQAVDCGFELVNLIRQGRLLDDTTRATVVADALTIASFTSGQLLGHPEDTIDLPGLDSAVRPRLAAAESLGTLSHEALADRLESALLSVQADETGKRCGLPLATILKLVMLILEQLV